MQSPDSTRSTMFVALRGGRWIRVIDLAIIGLIILNLFAVIVGSVESIGSRYRAELRTFEWVSVVVFTIEYVLRLALAPHHPSGRYRDPVSGRLRYALTPLAIVDLLAILPSYFAAIFVVDLRWLRVLRLLRIFKLTRYSSAMTILLTVLRDELPSFAAALFILVVILMLAASGMYVVEHEAQPEAFGSIPSAMWWAVATLTTVGYGDVTPITTLGKVFGSFVTIVGIGMVALPAGILASAFSDHLRERRAAYREQFERALADGSLSAEERRRLLESSHELGLDATDRRRLAAEAREAHEETSRAAERAKEATRGSCPHCGRSLDP